MESQVFGALGQPGVGWVTAIVIGALAGWLAEKFTRAEMGLLANIIVGIIGALIGNWLAGYLGVSVFGFWRNLVSATIGSMILIVIFRAVSGRRSGY